MKKFLASLVAAVAFASPVLAEDKVKSWRSFDSLGCMMLRECKEDVVELTTWSELGPEYGIAAEELDAIIACLLYTSPSPRDATLSRMPSSA